jgi:peptide chain release factor subunit 1
MADIEHDIHLWKLKRIIKNLDNLKGAGTSMITLVIPGGDQVCGYRAMLTTELGAASNIKSRVNRQSVITAITSALQKLKLYTKAPPNGLIVYTGTVISDAGRDKKINIDFEPFKPVNKYYKCDSVFHTEMLSEMLQSDTCYGFIIVGGDKTVFGTLTGSTKTVIAEVQGDIPNKTRRGGQSSARYGRLRDEAIHRYVSHLCELATQFYITNNLPNVTNIVIGGTGELKNDFVSNDHFEPQLRKIVTKIVDTSYSGMNGFNQAIELSADCLGDLQFIKEKKLLTEYMTELTKMGSGGSKICYGIKDTIYAMEVGAIDKLILWDELDIMRYQVKNRETGEEYVLYSAPTKLDDLDVLDEMVFTDWIAENYKQSGLALHFVTNKTTEGNQYCMGFGGIGGILRYQLQFQD